MRGFFFAAAIAATSSLSLAADCSMPESFVRPDDGGSSRVRVIASGMSSEKQSVLFASSLHVNTDGAKRSYKVEDFWGSVDAVNNLCNAMSDKCDSSGMNENERELFLRNRRLSTEKAKAGGWNAIDLAATKLDRAIIPFKDGKPCPEKDGFLVSATALFDKKITDQCEPKRYADSIAVSAIVLPRPVCSKVVNGKCTKRTPTQFDKYNAKVGDLVVMATPDMGHVEYAVVGDLGPTKELGEGTIALAKLLLGKAKDPVNYREIRGKAPFKGSWDVPQVITLILSGTRDVNEPYMTPDRIKSEAEKVFANWGGKTRLGACIEKYKN